MVSSRIIVLLACLLAISGCATGILPSIPDNQARLVILRGSDTSAAASVPTVLTLDGEKTLNLLPNTYAWIDLKPGDHKIGWPDVWPPHATCVGEDIRNGVKTIKAINLKEGDTAYIKVSKLTPKSSLTCPEDKVRNLPAAQYQLKIWEISAADEDTIETPGMRVTSWRDMQPSK